MPRPTSSRLPKWQYWKFAEIASVMTSAPFLLGFCLKTRFFCFRNRRSPSRVSVMTPTWRESSAWSWRLSPFRHGRDSCLAALRNWERHLLLVTWMAVVKTCLATSRKYSQWSSVKYFLVEKTLSPLCSPQTRTNLIFLLLFLSLLLRNSNYNICIKVLHNLTFSCHSGISSSTSNNYRTRAKVLRSNSLMNFKVLVLSNQFSRPPSKRQI